MQNTTKVAESRNDLPSVVYCWGNMTHGQLGLGGIEEEQIYEARELSALSGKQVTDVACGVHHTIFLLKSGVVYSCGNNDRGQLGHDKARRRPGMFNNVALVYNIMNGFELSFCPLYGALHSKWISTKLKVFKNDLLGQSTKND